MAHLDLLALLVSGVQPAQLDPQVHLDVLALRDLQALLERKVDREKKVLRAQPEEMVFRDRWVCQDQEDLRDHQERMETRVSLENQGRKEAKVTKESTVLLVLQAHKALSEHQVLLVQMESQVPGASRVCSARRETKDQEVSRDLQAQLGCRACLVHLVRKVKPETSVKWVHLDLLVPEVLRVPQVPTVLRDLPAVLETLVLLEKRETLVRAESQDFREKLVHQVREENAGRRGRLVLLELLDLLALKVHLEMMALRAALVRVASLETPDPLESPVQLV